VQRRQHAEFGDRAIGGSERCGPGDIAMDQPRFASQRSAAKRGNNIVRSQLVAVAPAGRSQPQNQAAIVVDKAPTRRETGNNGPGSIAGDQSRSGCLSLEARRKTTRPGRAHDGDSKLFGIRAGATAGGKQQHRGECCSNPHHATPFSRAAMA
jgi:hypothetical protein